MSYTPKHDYRSKDALPSGNPAKRVMGADLSDDFEAIETSVTEITENITSIEENITEIEQNITDIEVIIDGGGGGGGGDCACLNPSIWTDQLGLDLTLMAAAYVNENFPIHPLIEWTGGYMQMGPWRVGEGALGLQFIYKDTPEGMVVTEDGILRVTGEVRGQSDDVVDVVSVALAQTRSNKFTLGDFIISSVGERLCFYYQSALKAVIDEDGNFNLTGDAIANYGSVVRTVDVRSADYSFGDWFMSADGEKLSFGNESGVMATFIGAGILESSGFTAEGSIAAAGTVKESEVLV